MTKKHIYKDYYEFFIINLIIKGLFEYLERVIYRKSADFLYITG